MEAARRSHADFDFEVVIAKTSGELDFLVAATSPFSIVLCLSGRFLKNPFLVKGGESEVATALGSIFGEVVQSRSFGGFKACIALKIHEKLEI